MNALTLTRQLALVLGWGVLSAVSLTVAVAVAVDWRREVVSFREWELELLEVSR